MDSPTTIHRLFRFRAASENAFAEVAEGLGWFSRYDCLNDPFEGRYINKTEEPDFDHLIGTLRVLCFSQVNDNLLLWVHYADNHRGVCLEYEFTDKDYREQCMPVQYKQNQPVLDKVERFPIGTPTAGSLSVHINREAKVFLTKSDEWSYEQEVRIIRSARERGASGERWSIPGKLTAIYFGLRTSPQVISIISKLLHDRPSVNFWQAELIPGQFKLQFVPVTRDVQIRADR